MARKSRKVENTAVSSVALYIRTAQYIRLSVEDNKNRGNSIETQQKVLDNYIALNPEFTVHDVYIDNGLTGANFDRPEFKRMIEDVEIGKIDCVICKDLSRLGRNIIDTGFYIEKYFPGHNIRFIAVTDCYDSDDNTNSQAGVVMPLKNMINEAYSIEISKKIRAQAQKDMQSGKFIGARPPFGYIKDPNDCHKLIVDETAAPIVRQIFEWAANGAGLNTIVKRLNEAGFPTPNEYAQNNGIINFRNLPGKGKWQTRTVDRILFLETYTGDMVQGKTKSNRRIQTNVKDKTQWIRVKNTHEPIVNREVWETVQKIRENVANQHADKVVEPYTENIFKGKVFCASCGGSLHRSRNKRKKSADIYKFTCLTKSRVAKDICPGLYMPEVELLSTVLTVLKEQAKVIIGENTFVKRNNDGIQALQAELKAEKLTLNDRIDKDRRMLLSLYESLKQDAITQKEYFKLKLGYETKIRTTLDSLAACDEKIAELNDNVSAHNDLTDTLKDICADSDLDRDLIIKLIDKIKIDANRNVEISFNWQNEFDDILHMIGGVADV